MKLKMLLLADCIIALILLRNDFWFYSEPYLVFDALPISLVHQIGVSLSAALVWLAAVTWFWPNEEDEGENGQ